MTTAKAFFDRFSKEYEAQGRHRHLFYRWLISNIARQAGEDARKVLDLGTGTGELALRIAAKLPKSKVTGLDISTGMVGEAKRKARAMGIRNVRFLVSPMERVARTPADIAVSNLAFHHVKNKSSVISKIYWILPKGGKLVIGDWFKPSRRYGKAVEKLRRKNPKLAAAFDESWAQALREMSREYGRKHPKEYPVCPTELQEIMKKAGFRKQRILKSMLPNFAIVIGEK